MKIAYLLGSLNRGGAETLLLDVCRNARSNELDAIVIHRKSGVLEREFLETGVPMFKVPVGSNRFGYLFKLRKILIDNQIDIVHAQQPLDALLAWIICLSLATRVILTFHGYDYVEKKIGHLIRSFIIRHTYINVYVSKTQRNYYLNQYKIITYKQEVVYNGISFDKLDVAKTVLSQSLISNSSKLIRDELSISSTTLLLGAVGNFNDVRDQLTTCRFLKLLQEQDLDFHFVFVGKRIESRADLYDNCVGFCKSNGLLDSVSFLGVRNDVPMILNQLDAFIYSTHHDTFGIAVVEAMAVGIPVFVNDWGVMNEITDNGKYATIYKTGDENDLLREFMLFLQSKTDYVTKANDAAAFVRERYSIEKHIQNLKIVYSK